MNALGLLLVWTALQVSVFCLAGMGLYAITRRRSPAAGAWAAGTALVLAIAISALALSPWPRWWSPPATAPPAQVATGENNAPTPAADQAADYRFPPGMMSGPIEGNTVTAKDDDAPRQTWQATLSGFRDDVSRASVELSTPEWRWPAWVAIAILAGCALALVRLVVAVCVAHRYRLSARAVSDPPTLELLEEVRAHVACARPVDLRETSITCSPSTIGWLRPAIILPADWRSWSEQERRAIFAHEVAHIARGDFAVGLLAQLGVVLHFYNPLVHWLAQRLRLEQELAADVCGAQLAGGRQLYLTTLAQMALRRNDPPLAWAVRPFLPTRGTLMKRVEMLHRCKNLPSLAVSRGRRAVLVTTLLVVACFLAGFRPTGTSIRAEGARATAETATAAPFNLDFVPADAQFVLAMRPAELAKNKSLDSIKVALTAIGLFEPLELPLEEIDECKLVTGFAPPPARSWALLVLRGKKPHDWAKVASYFTGTTKEVIAAGQKYFESIDPRGGMLKSYWLPDDRTIVLAPTDMIVDTFSLRGDLNEPEWAARWRAVATGPAAMMIDTEILQFAFTGLKLNTGDAARNLTDDADTVFLGCSDTAGALEIQGTMPCRSPSSALQAQAVLAATFVNFSRFTEQFHNQRPAPPAASVFRLMSQLTEATKLNVKGSTVISQTAVNLKVDKEAFAAHLTQARTAALKNGSSNKLRQLGIAMQNHHDAYKRFPPAVLIGPDGKTPYSWRVALLPFLERNDLYQRYKKDEPWDSEHNRQLIAEGADLFSVPAQEPNANCGYFALTGPGTVFDPARPRTSVRNIVDGTSKTIGLVEAARSIPWTKPEDIEYNPNKPLPKLGGFFPGDFRVGAMDASVHVLPENVNEAVLRPLITMAGREPVAFPDPAEVAVQIERSRARTGAPAEVAARRARSVNTMKHLGIAMHNYHDQNGHFPSAVVIGPDGKTPHSWRVELLPYFEMEKLQEAYKQYRLDEPWDSDHNRMLIELGSEFFGTASESPNGDSCYFMLAGPGTMADPANPDPKIRSITDGTANTIYFVEAKRTIPWTMPQDIEYDPQKPMPKLGGFFNGGYDAAFVDGSVHFLPDDLDENALRALLSKNGREAVTLDPATDRYKVAE